MAYSFDDADAAERHETQYFEMFGNRGIYHKGWTAVTKHRTPWETGADVETPAFDDDVWELYDTTTDWSQAHDLAKEHPDKLHELQRLWLIEAVKYNVLPLDDRFVERGLPETAGRPTLDQGRAAAAVRRHGAADRELGAQPEEQVVLDHRRGRPCPSGRRGRDRRAGRRHRRLEPLRQGRQAEVLLQLLRPRALLRRGHEGDPARATTRCAWSSRTTAAASARAAPSRSTSTATRSATAASSRPRRSSSRPTRRCDVGNEFGSPVTTDYAQRKFTGEVNWVELDLGLDDHNHLIKPEDRVNAGDGHPVGPPQRPASERLLPLRCRTLRVARQR